MFQSVQDFIGTAEKNPLILKVSSKTGKGITEFVTELKKIKDNIAFSAERQAKKKDKSVVGRVINSENDIDFRNFQATDEMRAARESALRKMER